MFARFAELNVWITFLRQVQVDHRWRDIGQVVAAIKRQLNFVLTLKFFEFLHVRTLNPARGRHVDRFVNRFHVVLALQARNHHVELQHADRANNQIVVGDWTEHLHGALFRELNKAFQQLFLLQRIAQTNATEQLRCEVRNTRELHHLALGEGIADLDPYRGCADR